MPGWMNGACCCTSQRNCCPTALNPPSNYSPVCGPSVANLTVQFSGLVACGADVEWSIVSAFDPNNAYVLPARLFDLSGNPILYCRQLPAVTLHHAATAQGCGPFGQDPCPAYNVDYIPVLSIVNYSSSAFDSCGRGLFQGLMLGFGLCPVDPGGVSLGTVIFDSRLTSFSCSAASLPNANRNTACRTGGSGCWFSHISGQAIITPGP